MTTLNSTKTECVIDGVVLKVKQTIDYRSASSTRVSLGKIIQFRKVEEGSVWMLVADMGKEATTEWVSCNTWKENYDKGVFKQLKETIKEEVPNARTSSDEPEADDDYPF